MIARVVSALSLVFLLVMLSDAQEAPRPRLDLLGDPLPAGAVARLGTQRFKRLPQPGRHEAYAIANVLFSGNGMKIATCGAWFNRELHLWHAASGNEIAGFWNDVIPGPIALSADGAMLACSSEHFQGANLVSDISVWDIAAGKKLASLAANNSRVEAMTFATDGKTLAICAGPEVQWLDIPTGRVTKTVQSKEAGDGAVAAKDIVIHYRRHLSPGGTHLVVFSQQYDERTGKFDAAIGAVIDLAYQNPTWRLSIPSINDYQLAFSADSRRIAVTAERRTVEIRELATGKLVGSPPLKAAGLDSHTIAALALSSNGTELAIAWPDGRAALWNAAMSSAPRLFVSRTASVLTTSHCGLAFAPDDKTLALGRGPDLFLIDVPSLHEATAWAGHGDPVEYVAFAPDGASLISGSARAHVHFQEIMTWNTANWTKAASSSIRSLKEHDIGVISGDHTYYTGRANEDKLNVYALPGGKKVGRLPPLPQAHTPALECFSPTNRYYFLGTRDASGKAAFKAYSLPSCECVCEGAASQNAMAGGANGSVAPLCFSGNERFIAVAAEGQTIGVFEIATGKLIHRLNHARIYGDEIREFGQGPSVQVVLSHDGKTLASWAHGETKVTVWNLATGRKWDHAIPAEEPIPGQPRTLPRLNAWAWSQDGNILALAANRKIQLLEIATRTVRHEFAGHAGEIGSLAFSPTSRYLASGSADTTVLIWDMRAR
jgi:WD40 repeat protein